MYRLKQFLSSLEHQELMLLKQHIEKGTLSFEKEVYEKLKEHERKHSKQCSVCMGDLDPYNASNYTLLFGPDDFKKKGSFCGMDCMEYFLENLKEMKKGDVCEKTN